MIAREQASVQDLVALKTFVKVVERGSFVASAVDMYSSPSWISKKIARLEGEIGKRLLNRSTHELSLTESGKIFYEHALKILYDVDRAIDSVHEIGEDLSGTLRIQVAPGTGHPIILPMIFAFMREYPQLYVDAKISSGSADLFQRGIDLAIRSGSANEKNNQHGTVEQRQIGQTRYQILASAEYFARYGRPLHPRELVNHNCLIHANQPSANEWAFRDGTDAYAVRVSGTLVADNWPVLYAAARAGVGIGRFHTTTSAVAQERDGLESIFGDCIDDDRMIWAFYPHAQPRSRKLEVLLQYLTERLKTS